MLTPTAKTLVDQAIEQVKEDEIKLKGKTEGDILLDRFNTFIRYGKIPWKANDNNITKPSVWYYIKPYNMTDPKWASHLPDYFEDRDGKIENSHCLYGQE